MGYDVGFYYQYNPRRSMEKRYRSRNMHRPPQHQSPSVHYTISHCPTSCTCPPYVLRSYFQQGISAYFSTKITASANARYCSDNFLFQIHRIPWTSPGQTCRVAFRALASQVSHRESDGDPKPLVLTVVGSSHHIATEIFFQSPNTRHSFFSFGHLFDLC